MKIIRRDISMIRGDSESITVSLQDADGNDLPLVEGDIIYLRCIFYAFGGGL